MESAAPQSRPLHILAQATAEEMESEVQNKTWSIDELPQPLSSDVEPQDCQDMSRWLDHPPIADQVVTLLVLLYIFTLPCLDAI